MSSTHIPSKTAMANECGITRNTLARWMKRPDFPPETPQGWERQAVLAFAKDALAKAAKAQSGPHADLKAEKLKLECARLAEIIRIEKTRADQAEFAAATERKEFIAMHDVAEMVQAIRRGFDYAMGRFIERVKLRGDVDLLVWAERAEDAVLADLKTIIEKEAHE
jgi:hypothetical protein